MTVPSEPDTDRDSALDPDHDPDRRGTDPDHDPDRRGTDRDPGLGTDSAAARRTDSEPARPTDSKPARPTDSKPARPTDSERVPAATAPPRRRMWLLAGVALLVLAIDLVTKLLAVRDLEWRDPHPVLDGLVYLQLVRNPGAAFGMATGMTWLLSLIAVGVVVAIVRVASRLRSRGWAVALGLVLGGALGNLVDRIFRYPGVLRGWVIDFISVFAPDGRVWPVFNAADSAICTGGALLVLLALLGLELDGTRARGRRRSR